MEHKSAIRGVGRAKALCGGAVILGSQKWQAFASFLIMNGLTVATIMLNLK